MRHPTRLASTLALLLLLFCEASGQTQTQVLSPASDFLPDYTFRGSALTGWTTLGDATWRAQDGEIIASPRAGGGGGWLVYDGPYQDLQVFSRFRCAAMPCVAGVLMRGQRTPDGGMTGVFISLASEDIATYRITLDANGRELSRTRLGNAPNQMRIAPPPPPPAPPGAPAAAQGGGGGGGGGGAAAAAAAAARFPAGTAAPYPPAGVQLAELQPPTPGIRPGEWNTISAVVDANIFRGNLNGGNQLGYGNTGDESGGVGAVALYVGGGSEVRFRDVAFEDVNPRPVPAEQVSGRFRMQRLDEFSYAWDAAVADINRDGVDDVIAGPAYWLGPTYTERHEIYLGQTYSPSTQYVQNMITFAHDFTGDGWADVLASEGRAMVLYVNPRGVSRRWDRFPVLPGVTSELTVMRDIDGDSRPEIAYVIGGQYAYASYDPANPTVPWTVHRISEAGLSYNHGLGFGDIDGDGKLDMLAAAGWFEQPDAGPASGMWTYHPQAFARWSRSESAGGGNMAVWDVNGDGRNDVVTSLNAHGWGLAWFEQKRDAGGRISFERHMIMDDFTTRNAGGVTFSELHAGVMPADVDRDGVMDFVTGKRHWAHRESYTDPNPHGAPVLYWYRGVRNSSAPGGAEFVPELIHNRSGVGSGFKVADLNRDGAMDVITSASRGTFVFWGAAPGATRAAVAGQ